MKIAKSFVNIKNLFFPTLITVFSFAFVISIIAQPQPNNPDRGAKVGSAYAISDFETINTNNGNLMFNFPLGSLPKGRGEVGGGISLIYSSKLYDTHTERIQDMNVPCGGGPCTYFQKLIIDESDKGGWKYVLGSYTLELKDRRDRYNGTTPPVCWLDGQGATAAWNEMTYVYKVNMIFPDGSSHEMIPKEQTPSTDGQRFYRITPDGMVESCGATPAQDERPTYYSIDGSYLRLQKTSNTEWTLYFPDGKKVVTTASSQRTYDRNGNYVDGPNDQFGRTVSIVQSSENEDIVRSSGANGEKLDWKVTWKNIFVKKTYQACTPIQGNNCPQEHQRKDLGILMRVVDQIIQPQQLGGQAYTFSYNAPDFVDPPQTSEGWGEISRVTLPSGAYIDYEYAMDGQDGPGDDWNIDEILKNHPISKTLHYALEYDNGPSSASETWTYSTSASQGTIVSPDGGTVTNYFGNSPNGWDSGLTYKTVSSTGTMTEKLWERNFPEVCNSTACNPLAPANTYVKTEFNSIKDSSGNYSLTAIKDYSYDKNGNVTLVKEYDWVAYSSVPRDQYGQVTGIPSGITPKRISATGYYAETPDAGALSTDTDLYILPGSPALKGTVKWSEIRNGSNQAVSRTEITYDNAATTGNPIETKAWDSTKGIYSTSLDSSPSGNAISTKTQYNSYGMPTVTTDANGVQTTISYGDIDTPNGTVSDLYPTKVETASNYSTLKRTSTFTYDFLTGLTLTSTDLDNGITNAIEYDDAGRPKKSISAQGTALESWTVTEYDDALRRIIVRSDLEALGDGKKVAIQHFDPLGRVRLSRTLEDAATEDATKEHDGIKVQTRYKYTTGQSGGSYTLTSNPYRASNSSGASSEETMGWSVSYESTSGNLSTSEEFSGAALPAPWGSNSNSTGTSKEEESANTTTITDEAGKKRRTINDALGRMIRVDEPNDSNEFGSISSPNQATEYLYDPLGNLTQIVQSGQTRSFSYSSLSRLLQATNPESGTFQYTYDNNGNLSTKTDARSVITTYIYDALNRATFRNYSDATPDITYTYDDNQVPFSQGKLTKTSSSISESLITGYDEQERITGSSQVLDPKTYDFTYTYDLADNLVTQTYPSGKVVSFDYDKSGNLALVAGQDAEGQTTYANSFDYAAHDQVRQLRFGNGKWETRQFNGARQITQIGLGHSSDDTGLWKTNYEYGEWESGNLNTQKNNGNLARQTVTVPTIANVTGFTAVQTYTYDSLDRLKSAVEKVSGAEKWKQSFLHDRFGNRNFDTANTTLRSVESTVAKVNNPEILATSNRFKTDQDNDNQDDYVYDSSGNLTQDALGRQFSYDAENRQTTATGSGVSVSYAYDGNGKRVKTYNAINDQTTIFVYDAEGDLAAEYTINVPQPQNPTISYTTEDALGSPRVITDLAGTVKARRDFLPYGEELYAGNGDRTTNQKFAPNGDTTRQKFTGYQRDVETGLDFAQSRYYSPMQGRFTSPDEFKGGPDELFDFEEDASSNPTFYADLTNPQSLNKYQYTYNNPYKYTDPSGHNPCCLTTLTWPELIISIPKIPAIPKGTMNPGPYGTIALPRPRLKPGEAIDDYGNIYDSSGNLIARPRTSSPRQEEGAAGRARPRPITSAPKRGGREGRPFTPKGKREVIDKSKTQNNGKPRCENCGKTTVKPNKPEKGVSPNPRETNVDHIKPKSKGGSGTPDNGQVLCRSCNIGKGDKVQ